MIGRVVGGNYRIVETLGEGGMGTVYKAVDLMLEREVAIKAIKPELTRESEVVERFRAEAKMLARISHPAIATIYSFFVDGEDLFLVMEFVRGTTLSRVLQRDGPLRWEGAVPLLAGALDGIEQAHRAGIVHRDLKPDNLMITVHGMMKVMDFGIARVMGSGRLTRTGLLIGTLRYMAPEQIRGEEVDRRTDVYALGTVLYEMVTGRVPFDGASDYAVLKAHVEESPVPPSVALPDLPPWLDQAILKALAKQPAQRFQTVEEMRRFLLGQGAGEIGTGQSPLGIPGISGIPGIPITEQQTLARTPTPFPAAPLAPPATPSAEIAPTVLRPSSALPPAPPSPQPLSHGPQRERTHTGATSSYREIGGAGRDAAKGRSSRLLVASFLLLLVIVAAAIGYRLRTPARPVLASAGAPPGAAAAADGSAGPLTPGAAIPASGGAAIPAQQAGGPGAPGGTPNDASAAGGPSGAGQAAAGGMATGSPGAASPAPAEAAAADTPASEQRQRARGGEAQQPATGSDASATQGQDQTAGNQPTGAAAGNERFGGLPALELHRLAGELQKESAYLTDLYTTVLARRGNAMTSSEQRLSEELKTFQSAADHFSLPFQGGFFARARNGLGRLSHGEDQRTHIVRLARDLTTSGARIDTFMHEVNPAPAIRKAWSRIRRQWTRVAEICGT